ncbi:MAG: aromatic amino acid ammonia-lyase [Patescibacteria group bacterium]
MEKQVIITGSTLTLEEVVLIARGYVDETGDHLYPVVTLSDDAKERITKQRAGLEERIAAGDIIYGVNTGCGIKKGTILPTETIDAYQKHYIPAHCVQTGDYFPEEVVRAAMILRVNSFATGCSGMRLETCEKILEFYNKGVIPCVPEQGSVGSSGDLAPLAHVAAALTGLPGQDVWAEDDDSFLTICSAPEAMKLHKIKPLVLRAKEAMGLTNGATFTLALGLLAIYDAEKLFKFSDLAAALSLEAIRGEKAAFDERLIGARNHQGAAKIAKTILRFTAGSKRMTKASQDVPLKAEVDAHTKKYDEGGKPVPRVQDAYSFRAYPPVAGSAYEAFKYAQRVFTDEINAATDNPLIFPKPDGGFEALSGGNFHGEPLGQAMDFLKIALQQLANISDRRIYALTMTGTSYGLPSDLAGLTHQDLNTGFMILQYSTAAMVSENKVLCHPSVVDSVPTSANQEDYVSMSTISARHAHKVLANSRFVIACEILAACQGISLTEKELAVHGCDTLGEVTGAAYSLIRKHIKAMDDDRMLSLDTEEMLKLMKGDELLSIL